MTLNVGVGLGCLCGKTDPTCLYAGWGAGAGSSLGVLGA